MNLSEIGCKEKNKSLCCICGYESFWGNWRQRNPKFEEKLETVTRKMMRRSKPLYILCNFNSARQLDVESSWMGTISNTWIQMTSYASRIFQAHVQLMLAASQSCLLLNVVVIFKSGRQPMISTHHGQMSYTIFGSAPVPQEVPTRFDCEVLLPGKTKT